MKGIKRKNSNKSLPRSPTVQEFMAVEVGINEGSFTNLREQHYARAVVRAIHYYRSADAKTIFGNLSKKSRAELERILEEHGLEFDFPDPD